MRRQSFFVREPRQRNAAETRVWLGGAKLSTPPVTIMFSNPKGVRYCVEITQLNEQHIHVQESAKDHEAVTQLNGEEMSARQL